MIDGRAPTEIEIMSLLQRFSILTDSFKATAQLTRVEQADAALLAARLVQIE